MRLQGVVQRGGAAAKSACLDYARDLAEFEATA